MITNLKSITIKLLAPDNNAKIDIPTAKTKKTYTVIIQAQPKTEKENILIYQATFNDYEHAINFIENEFQNIVLNYDKELTDKTVHTKVTIGQPTNTND